MAVPSIGRAPEPRPTPPFVRALDHAMPVELWWRVLGLIPERTVLLASVSKAVRRGLERARPPAVVSGAGGLVLGAAAAPPPNSLAPPPPRILSTAALDQSQILLAARNGCETGRHGSPCPSRPRPSPSSHPRARARNTAQTRTLTRATAGHAALAPSHAASALRSHCMRRQAARRRSQCGRRRGGVSSACPRWRHHCGSA